MNFRKSLCSALLLALLLETSSSIQVLATTETTTSEPAVTSEITSTTTEETTTTVVDAILPSTETLPSTEATTTTEEAVENRKPMEDSGLPVLESAISIARGDDYPDYLKKIPYANYTIDPWSYYHRQCTSFAAFRLIYANGFTDVRNFGNAFEWGSRAKSRGYTVNKTPALGSIAWWDANAADASSYGHVAWVSGINGDYVEIEDYNSWRGGPGLYNKRLIHKSRVSGFIHFKDIANKNDVQSVGLNTNAQTLAVGSSFNLTATVSPATASNKAIKWQSTNPKVATVVNGKVTAIKAGTVDIIATTVSGGKIAKARITVQNKGTFKIASVYRLYHPGNKRHLYTKDPNEANTLSKRGWNFEGRSFGTATAGQPVYRLYNSSLKEHLYTTSKAENDALASRGWSAEGVAWYSSGTRPVYRLYHPGLNIHLYSSDKNEVNVLVTRGWKNENISFYTH